MHEQGGAQTAVTDPRLAAALLGRRVGRGLRRRTNWMELVRFATVGGSGYFLNVGVFGLLVHAAEAPHRTAATVAFAAALTNNFIWHRFWTFGATDGEIPFQAARFFGVSVAAFALGVGVLEALVASGTPPVVAQTLAILSVTPVSFLGNKLWSFAP